MFFALSSPFLLLLCCVVVLEDELEEKRTKEKNTKKPNNVESTRGQAAEKKKSEIFGDRAFPTSSATASGQPFAQCPPTTTKEKKQKQHQIV
jgi:hypothetical protein